MNVADCERVKGRKTTESKAWKGNRKEGKEEFACVAYFSSLAASTTRLQAAGGVGEEEAEEVPGDAEEPIKDKISFISHRVSARVG